MSMHNICFRREIRKIIRGYLLLSVAMLPNKKGMQGLCQTLMVNVRSSSSSDF